MRQGCLRKSVQVCVHPIPLLYSLRRIKSSRRERGEALALLQQQLTRYDQSAGTNGQVQLPLASVLFIRHCKCFTFIIWPKPPNRFTCMCACRFTDRQRFPSPRKLQQVYGSICIYTQYFHVIIVVILSSGVGITNPYGRTKYMIEDILKVFS